MLDAQSCLAHCDPIDCTQPASSVPVIFKAKILEWVAISYSRGSSWPRDPTHIPCVSHTGRQILYHLSHQGSLWRNLLFSRPVLSNSLWLHALQQTRPPCLLTISPFAQVHVHCTGDAIQPSHPLMPSSSSDFSLSQHQRLFQWVGCLHQFSSVQSLSCVRLFLTPWTTAHQASLSITNTRRSPKPMSIESVMPSNHLNLCHPLLLLLSIFPSIRVFSNESALHIRWPKYWSFSFNISPSSL